MRGRRRRKENNRNVVVVVVLVVLAEEKIEIYVLKTNINAQHSTSFLSLYFAPEELTRVGSVLSAKNPLVEKIICKGT